MTCKYFHYISEVLKPTSGHGAIFIVVGGLASCHNDNPPFVIKTICGATSDDSVGIIPRFSANNLTVDILKSTDIPSYIIDFLDP